jgi:antitoxin component of MazEF toxin-antitoxin module
VVKTLTKVGNSLALVIDKPILDLLKIDADTPLEVSTHDGKSLTIVPVDRDRAARFAGALEKVNRKHGRALRKLAE